MHFDVIVAGGGFAGVGAAVSAARHGRRVLLIDKNGALGGAANESLVMPFMPYFTFVPDGEGKTRRVDLVRGIFSEISAALRVEGADAFFDPLLFDSERLKTVLDDLVTEAGVQVLFHTTVTEAVIDDGRLTAMRAYACGQMMTFSADVFVDATGDGALAALCGCRFHVGREEDGLCQPMTLCFRVGGVDYAAFSRELPAMQALYKQRQAEGKIKNPREDLLVFPTPHKGLIHFNSTRILRADPTDPFALSRAEMEGRRQMRELFAFLQEDFPLFSEAYIVSCAASIGVRESRMVVGEHRLTGEELMALTKFPDAVAAGNYDIDIHNPTGSGTSHYYFPAGEYYTVPYRSLVAADVDRLLVAGRCLSCDHEAQASIRIMPICCATGQAAGTAAAMLCGTDTAARDLDTDALRRTLTGDGAFC